MLPDFSQEPLLQAVIDALPQQIAILDQAGCIVAANRAWREFAGDDGNGNDNIREPVGEDYLAACCNLGGETGVAEAGVRAVLAGAAEFKLEYACHRPPVEYWFSMQATPLSRATGGAVVSQLDITARKQLEAERAGLLVEAQRTRVIAEAANRAKDEFLAQTTHDLRSPLSAILGWTKVLRSRSLDHDAQADALAVIERSAEKQKLLIDDLLNVSRTSQRAVSTPHEPTTTELQCATPKQEAPKQEESLRGLLIVVVDDEADARDLVALVLRQQGAEVLTASLAEEAYRLIAEAVRVPDLLVSDISMPGEDGYSLIRRVRSLLPAQGGRIPAVALTAFSRMEDRLRALTAGFEMHLSKPVELTELILVAGSLTGREVAGQEG